MYIELMLRKPKPVGSRCPCRVLRSDRATKDGPKREGLSHAVRGGLGAGRMSLLSHASCDSVPSGDSVPSLVASMSAFFLRRRSPAGTMCTSVSV